MNINAVTKQTIWVEDTREVHLEERINLPTTGSIASPVSTSESLSSSTPKADKSDEAEAMLSRDPESGACV